MSFQLADTSSRVRALVIFFLLTGLLSSLYLLYLDHEVGMSGEGAVQSFCAISEEMNCVKVAASEYASFMGVPLALFGAEFFALMMIAVLISFLDKAPVKHWEAPLLLFSGLAIPFCAWLAYVSLYIIESVCVVCCAVYFAIFAIFLILGFSQKWHLSGVLKVFINEWICFFRRTPRMGSVCLIIFMAGISQFAWVPELMTRTVDRELQVLDNKSVFYPQKSEKTVLIEEYTDFECPFCAKAHYVIHDLLENYSESVCHELHHYPLDDACNPDIKRPFHKNACLAARYAVCAEKQGLLAPYQELVWKNRKVIKTENLEAWALEVGLNCDKLSKCVNDSETINRIRSDIQKADLKGGVSGTPTFWINGEKVEGLRSYEFWVGKLESILSASAVERLEVRG